MQELKAIMDNAKNIKKERHQEVVVRGNYLKVQNKIKINTCRNFQIFLKSEQSLEPEMMYLEDLAALENLTEDIVIEQLQQRLKKGGCYSYLGDVLLFVNPNEQLNIYNDEVSEYTRNPIHHGYILYLCHRCRASTCSRAAQRTGPTFIRWLTAPTRMFCITMKPSISSSAARACREKPRI